MFDLFELFLRASHSANPTFVTLEPVLLLVPRPARRHCRTRPSLVVHWVWVVSVRTSCRAPGPNDRVPQAGCGSTRLEDYLLRRRPRPEGRGNREGRVERCTSHHRLQRRWKVDGYPINTRGKRYSSSFSWSGPQSMFADLGFRPIGALGTSKWVMRKVVRSRSWRAGPV
jgi:hypothetical protein